MSEPYTDADVQLVAQAIWDATRADFAGITERTPTGTCYDDARAILAALAEAGRLTPDGAVREEWGVRLIWDDPLRQPDEFEAQNRHDAEQRYETHVEARRRNPQWEVTPRLIHRTKITHVGPWVEADEDGTG